ncbi:MAG: iron-containing alcohol dehydrogenase [Betaproteobacteria bacterium]|nr:iron-containing alcohol dehydrogenase [Betaproteobacteria bacterium]
MYIHDFRATGYPYRLYSGQGALDKLPGEVDRARARRVFVVCGRTVSRSTPLIGRIRALLGERLAGVFDEIAKDTTLDSVLRAAEAARAAQADLVIGVGAGSVLQAARVVVILLAETRPIEELITRYPEHGPAVSPKLLAPKLPIINVLTAATTAQNRAGSRVKDESRTHGMEFFDPKTRPAAIFWDAEALLTAPPQLARTTAVSVYWRAVMNLGAASMNPLVEGDRLQAYRLAAGALHRVTAANDAAPRIDLCAAALLQNREADDGGTLFERHWVGRVTYAFVTALFSVYPRVAQGEANSALTGTVMRRLGARDVEAMARIAATLGAWNERMPPAQAPGLAADRLEEVFRAIGMPTRLSELGIDRGLFPRVIEYSLKNFNADPQREFVRERPLLEEVLAAAW